MNTVYNVRLDGGAYSGFLIKRTPKILLLHEIRDFFDEGFSLFVRTRSAIVNPIKKGHVFYAGLRLHRIKKRNPPFQLNRLSLPQILEWLRKSDLVVLIEFGRGKSKDVFLGLIDSVNSNVCVGRFFHIDGKLGAPEVIQIKSIRRVQWGDRYTVTMRMLIRGR